MKYTRELTTLVAGPVAILIIGWAPPLVFDAAVGLCALLALYEFLVMGRHKGFHLPIPLCMVLALFILVAFVV